MTREEEKQEKAIELAKKHMSFCGLPITECVDVTLEMADWADQHPSVDTVKKIICYALKYTNIMFAEDLENGVEWELLIKKQWRDKIMSSRGINYEKIY